jgi:formate C-acetyltransferase
MTLESCEAFLRAAAKSAMQSLQLNCTSKEQLLDAQKHPEKYPDLIVRVTGFSAKFTSLSPEWQQEFLTRNFYE